jgi:hypothetical protein
MEGGNKTRNKQMLQEGVEKNEGSGPEIEILDRGFCIQSTQNIS